MSAGAFILTLILTVWNTEYGTQLEKITVHLPAYIIPEWGEPRDHLAKAIEDCRVRGVEKAYQLTDKWQKQGFYWSTTNVNCKWAWGHES